MDLEELELRFTANYGDVMRKLDEFTNIISQKTNDMQYKIQDGLGKINQSMNDNVSKANESVKEEVRQRTEAEQAKQKLLEQTLNTQMMLQIKSFKGIKNRLKVLKKLLINQKKV